MGAIALVYRVTFLEPFINRRGEFHEPLTGEIIFGKTGLAERVAPQGGIGELTSRHNIGVCTLCR